MKATLLYFNMQHEGAWARGIAWQAQRLEREYQYDKMEPDLGFIYFKDGSVLGCRPKTKDCWVRQN